MNGYIGYYKGKKMEVLTEKGIYAAKCQMAKEHNIKDKDICKINIMLAEKNGEQVIHSPLF